MQSEGNKSHNLHRICSEREREREIGSIFFVFYIHQPWCVKSNSFAGSHTRAFLGQAARSLPTSNAKYRRYELSAISTAP